MRAFRLAMLVFVAVGGTRSAAAQAEPRAAVVAEFTNPALSPSHWTMTLYRDGSGHFHSQRGGLKTTDSSSMDAPDIDRGFQVSSEFAEQTFKVAWEHKWFSEQCESHMKVAFQGWKKISYQGPEGKGSCTFNYSKDKEIQSLGDSLTGLAETLIEGARLETLKQHDRLGLDKEMDYMAEALKDGRLREIGAIQEILMRLEDDPTVLDRVRKRARALLAQSVR